MGRVYFESAMSLPFDEIQANELKKYSILRFDSGEISEIESDMEFFLGGDNVNIGVLEFSLVEVDSRIARYFRGSRSLAFLDEDRKSERFMLIKDGHALWFNFVGLDGVKDIRGVFRHFFGMSRALLLVSAGTIDTQGIFDRISARLDMGQISYGVRRCLSSVVDPLFEGGCCMVGSGLGSEDYGGYVFDVFMRDKFSSLTNFAQELKP